MKNFLIVGPPRAGKTTLSNLIVNNILGYSVINTDVIRDGIYESFFKEIDKKERKAIVAKNFPSLIKKMIDHYKKYYNPGIYYVIEGDILSIEDALEIRDQYGIDIICIGTPNISEKDLFDRTRLNASKYGCWTDRYDDNELKEICKKIIERSKNEETISRENGITYLDTSYDYKCLMDYVNELKNK